MSSTPHGAPQMECDDVMISAHQHGSRIDILFDFDGKGDADNRIYLPGVTFASPKDAAKFVDALRRIEAHDPSISVASSYTFGD